MCQRCVDEGILTQATNGLIDAFTEEWPGSESGPAHIVLADCNVEDVHLRWCIDMISVLLGDAHYSTLSAEDQRLMLRCECWCDHDRRELTATREFLLTLLQIPEEER